MLRLNRSILVMLGVAVSLAPASYAAATSLFYDDFTAPNGTTLISRGYTELVNTGSQVYNNAFAAADGLHDQFVPSMTVTAPDAKTSWWTASVDLSVGYDVYDSGNNAIQFRGNTSSDPRWMEVGFANDGDGTGHFNVGTWDSSGTGIWESILYGSGSSQTYNIEIHVDVANLQMRGLVNGTPGSWRSITAADLPKMNQLVMYLDARGVKAGAVFDNLSVEDSAGVLFSDDFTAANGTHLVDRGYVELVPPPTTTTPSSIYNNRFESGGSRAFFAPRKAVVAPGADSSWKTGVELFINYNADDSNNNGFQLQGNTVDSRWVEILFISDGEESGHFMVNTWDNAGLLVSEEVLSDIEPSATYLLEIEVDVDNLQMRGLVNGTAGSWRSITAVDLASMDKVVMAMDALGSKTGAAYDNLFVVEGTPIPGDANNDNDVDADDAAILAANWLSAGGWGQGDFNDDGVVDDKDAALLAANWGVGTAAGGASVPEPACLILLIGLAGMVAWGRLRRQQILSRLESQGDF